MPLPRMPNHPQCLCHWQTVVKEDTAELIVELRRQYDLPEPRPDSDDPHVLGLKNQLDAVERKLAGPDLSEFERFNVEFERESLLKEIEDALKPKYDDLTYEAYTAYKTTQFGAINQGLRAGDLERMIRVGNKNQRLGNVVDAMDEVFKHEKLTHNTVLTRVVPRSGRYTQLKVGDTFEDLAYTSTSRNPLFGSGVKNQTRLRINAPKETPAVDMELWGGQIKEHEQEILLARGSKFKVKRVQTIDGELTIDLDLTDELITAARPRALRPGPANLADAIEESRPGRSLLHRGENVKDDAVRQVAKKNTARDLATKIVDDPDALAAYEAVHGPISGKLPSFIRRADIPKGQIEKIRASGVRIIDDISELRTEMIDEIADKAGHRVHGWAKTSADADVAAIRYQIAVREEFGLTDTLTTWTPAIEKKALAQADELALDRIWARKQYDLTQEMLAREGIEEITAFRGVGWMNDNEFLPDWARSMKVGNSQVVSTQFQPLSSFSSFADDSLDFAMHSANPSLIINDRQILMTVRIPRRQVLSTSRSGMGALNEHELTVLGGINDVQATRTLRSTLPGDWNDDRHQFLKQRSDEISRQEKQDRAEFESLMQPISIIEGRLMRLRYQIEVIEERERRGLPQLGEKKLGGIEGTVRAHLAEIDVLERRLENLKEKAEAERRVLQQKYGSVYG